MKIGFHGPKHWIGFCAAPTALVGLPFGVANRFSPALSCVPKSMSRDDMFPFNAGCSFSIFSWNKAARVGVNLIGIVVTAFTIKRAAVVLEDLGGQLLGLGKVLDGMRDCRFHCIDRECP